MSMLISDIENCLSQLIGFTQAMERAEIVGPVSKLEDCAIKIGKSWGGSWIGYQSRVYFKDFTPPPAGAEFSQEWGFLPSPTGSRGDWILFEHDQVTNRIKSDAGEPDITKAEKLSKEGVELFDSVKYEVLSILESLINMNKSDNFIKKMNDEVDELKIFSSTDYISSVGPQGVFSSRDSLALSQGIVPPPHIAILAWIFEIREPQRACQKLSEILTTLISHVERKEKTEKIEGRIGTNVFIGHGGSPLWRELKDFVQDRCHLPYDEFNRVPIGGITNIARLSEMLDSAAIAFLIFTAEDEQADGSFNPRQNVIHEAGLFQGRLGFSKAIILLEEGCNEFSNIDGLGQVRFPSGNIEACFEKVRLILERESLIE